MTAINVADVNSMPAGPEMDALVAEKVMRYINWAFGVPRYSESLDAAWEVVERMKSRWVYFGLMYGPYLVRDGNLTYGWKLEPALNGPVCGFGETPQLAICRAALKTCVEG